MHYLKAMLKLDRQTLNPDMKALKRSSHDGAKQLAEHASQDSLLDKNTLKALDDAVANAQIHYTHSNTNQNSDKDGPVLIEQPTLVNDEELLEAFFSDEDDTGISTVESLHSVMKRVGKKAALMIEGINQCQVKMSSNQALIKSYLLEGKKPNAEFKKNIQPLSQEFIKVAQLKFHRQDAD